MSFKKIANKIDIPQSAVGTGCVIEINEDGELLVEGKCEILSYSDNEISIQLSSHILSVTGVNLTIHSLAHCTIEIQGKILGIGLTERKSRWKKDDN